MNLQWIIPGDADDRTKVLAAAWLKRPRRDESIDFLILENNVKQIGQLINLSYQILSKK